MYKQFQIIEVISISVIKKFKVNEWINKNVKTTIVLHINLHLLWIVNRTIDCLSRIFHYFFSSSSVMCLLFMLKDIKMLNYKINTDNKYTVYTYAFHRKMEIWRTANFYRVQIRVFIKSEENAWVTTVEHVLT